MDYLFHGESRLLSRSQQGCFAVRAEVEFHHHAATLLAAFAWSAAYFG